MVALLTVSLVGTVGVLWWAHARKTKDQTLATEAPGHGPAGADYKEPASFGDLDEANAVGRYRIIDGPKVSFVFLNEDHTFINTDGTTYPQYQWTAEPNRLVLIFQRGSSTFTTFERAGVYSRRKPEGGVIRMERLPDLPAAEAIAVDDKHVVGSLVFAETIQGSHLELANTESDGALRTADIEGKPCYQLERQRNRMSAFLYARIAPELKQEPFTNALVIVEYFDVPMRDPLNGWISLQYDGQAGAYASTCQRVRLGGSMTWKRATFVLEAPLFEGRENGGADFRLCLAESKLPIRTLKVAKNKALP